MPSAFRPSRHSSRPIRVSFEFFPPKSAEMETTLWSSVQRLSPLQPAFVSVTYGAGGSTRERTHATLQRILAETPLKPAAHLTCVAATREEIDEVVCGYWDIGVRHIVALRGDPMAGIGTAYEAHPGGCVSRRNSRPCGAKSTTTSRPPGASSRAAWDSARAGSSR